GEWRGAEQGVGRGRRPVVASEGKTSRWSADGDQPRPRGEAMPRDDDVRGRLARPVLTAGFHSILDLRRSCGSWIVDAETGERYLDLYSFFASSPLGINPPGVTGDPEFMALLAEAAANKPTNPDIYTSHYADFVDVFARVIGDPALPHLFFVEGGALAVAHALKCAFPCTTPPPDLPPPPP